MKTLSLLLIASGMIVGICFTACKKPAHDELIPEQKYPGDSCSFVFGGEKFTFIEPNPDNSFGIANRPAHVKLDSLINGKYYTSKSKDSILFNTSFVLYNTSGNAKGSLKVSFFKKYHIADPNFKYEAFWFFPQNTTDLYYLGKYALPVDIDRENSTNGVALEFSDWTTYESDWFTLKPVLTVNIQQESNFEVTSLKKVGRYLLLEAKFSGKMTRDNLGLPDEIKTLENGYLRLTIPDGPYY